MSKQDDNAKLLFGTKGKTIVANLAILKKHKKHLDENTLAMLDTTGDVLKHTLGSATIAKLYKKPEFATVPKILTQLVKTTLAKVKLEDAQTLAVKNVKPLAKFFS